MSMPLTAQRPPAPSFFRIIQKNFFATKFDFVVTILGLSLLAWGIWVFLNWAFFDSVWRAHNADLCHDVSGACWAVIEARWRLILFGLYPAEEHWRSAIACAIIVFVAFMTCMPYFWSVRKIATIWIIGFSSFYILMHGGMFGLSVVTTDRWGGLSLTVFLFASIAIVGMPLAILLAFGRRSKLRAISAMCGFTIDTIRSFPLLTILFTAAVIMPFALPDWAQGDKLTRVICGFSLFFACYQAEIIRGGLQAIPPGQEEAAKALGIGYLRTVFDILLPQAFRNALPATVNQFVITFKETSIIIIIGFFEILAAANAAFGTKDWVHAYVEVYFFVALVYFVFVFSLSRYGAYLERRMRVGLN